MKNTLITNRAIRKKYAFPLSLLSFITIGYFIYLNLSPLTEEAFFVSFNFPKGTSESSYSSSDLVWRKINIQSGMNLASIFQKENIPMKTLMKIVSFGKEANILKSLQPDTSLELGFNEKNELINLAYQIEQAKYLSISSINEQIKTKIISLPLEIRRHYANVTIKSSLFSDAIEANLSDSLINEIASIFSFDIDFAKDIHPGDSFTVIYENYYSKDKKARDGNIVAAQFINRGTTYKSIRYSPPNGTPNYYREDGSSVKTAFQRTPVKYTRISSRYSNGRDHPILNTIRAHKGVDYAAPIGTPVKSTGDGKVTFVGRKNGYGKTIEVKHGIKYSTLYAHLNGFAKNLKVGTRIKQDQLIGFVGKTGLATGPHLHYEFRVRGKHVNPQTVKFPVANSLSGRVKKDFLAHSRPLFAQLDLYNQATNANSSDTKSA